MQTRICTQMAHALVIGSGVAGLASAIRLRAQGHDVTVFEANSYAGGKLHAFQKNGFRFDMGPSLFTMPHLVDELFRLHGKNPKQYFEYSRKDTVCNYFWDDGTRFSASADKDQFVRNAANTFDVEPADLHAYLKRCEEKFKITEDVFLKRSLHKLDTYLSASTIRSFLRAGKLNVFETLDQVNTSHFNDAKLVQLFNRYATYNGSSPYSTPGIMSMIPHLEMDLGTFFPKGGMHAITQSLEQLAKDVGVAFRFDEPVRSIMHDKDRVHGVETVIGKYNGDIVFTNMDVFSTFNKLLPNARKPKRTLKQERSSSALIFYWGINRRFKELDLHNIFFSDDYEKEFSCIFQDKTLFDDPTVYVNITAKENAKDAPEDCENWFVMINTPGNFGQDWEALKQQARKNILSKLSRVLGVNIEDLIISEDVLDPVLIEKRTSSHRGSLYGTSSNSRFASFLRHPNFSRQFKNLYFCGGSVHPGGGIPLCLLSAKIATDHANG